MRIAINCACSTGARRRTTVIYSKVKYYIVTHLSDIARAAINSRINGWIKVKVRRRRVTDRIYVADRVHTFTANHIYFVAISITEKYEVPLHPRQLTIRVSGVVVKWRDVIMVLLIIRVHNTTRCMSPVKPLNTTISSN